MATTFDQRAKLHARVVELQELVLSQEGTLSTLESELDAFVLTPPPLEELRAMVTTLNNSDQAFARRVGELAAQCRQAVSYLQDQLIDDGQKPATSTKALTSTGEPPGGTDRTAGEDEDEGTLVLGDVSARSSIVPDEHASATPAFESTPLKKAVSVAPADAEQQEAPDVKSSEPVSTASVPASVSKILEASPAALGKKASQTLPASQDTHVSATPSPPAKLRSPSPASPVKTTGKPPSRASQRTPAKGAKVSALTSKTSGPSTPGSAKVKEEKTKDKAIPPPQSPHSPAPSSGFSSTGETEDEKDDAGAAESAPDGSPVSAKRPPAAKKGKATAAVRLASPAVSVSSTGTSRSGLARKGKARDVSPASTVASVSAKGKGKKSAAKGKAAREEAAAESASGIEDDDSDLDEDEDEEDYDSEPVKRTAKATAARMRNAKLRRDSVTRSITGSQAGSVAGDELTDEQKEALHEQKKLERRIRDRARRERERDTKAAKKEEPTTGRSSREKKRKLAEEGVGRSGSPAGASERLTKRAREDFSETPDEAGPSAATGTRRSSVSASAAPLPASLSNPKSFKKTIDLLFQSISNHRSSSIFQVPIRANEAPDYHDIVYRPMDLRTIKGRIRDGQISTVDEFERDVMLMFANALIYNDPESDVYQRTEEMMADSEESIRQFRQLQQRLASQHE